MLSQDNYLKGRLVELGWRYSGVYGGYLGGQMVMHAIANRVKAGWGSWLQVIDNVPKYIAENELPPLVHPSIWEPGFVKLLHAVDGVFDGSIPDLAHGGLYWCNTTNVQRAWFKEKILGALEFHPQTANQNSVTFFK